MPAGLVLMIVVGALFIAMLGNADATLRKSDGKRGNAEWRKTIANDIAEVADFLHLTTPRTKLDEAMGRQTKEKAGGNLDELLAQQAAATGDGTDSTVDPASLKPVIRTPTVDNPLRIWIGGDSVSQVLVPKALGAGDPRVLGESGVLPIAVYLVAAGAVLAVARARGRRWRDLAASARGETERGTAHTASA